MNEKDRKTGMELTDDELEKVNGGIADPIIKKLFKSSYLYKSVNGSAGNPLFFKAEFERTATIITAGQDVTIIGSEIPACVKNGVTTEEVYLYRITSPEDGYIEKNSVIW